MKYQIYSDARVVYDMDHDAESACWHLRYSDNLGEQDVTLAAHDRTFSTDAIYEAISYLGVHAPSLAAVHAYP